MTHFILLVAITCACLSASAKDVAAPLRNERQSNKIQNDKILKRRRLTLEVPTYIERTSSLCGTTNSPVERTITTAAACLAGGRSRLSWYDTTLKTLSDNSKPPGCYMWISWIGTKHLYFNRALSSTSPYTTTRKGLCDVHCGLGTYQDSNGQYFCKNCIAGQFQDQRGRGSCKS